MTDGTHETDDGGRGLVALLVGMLYGAVIGFAVGGLVL